jgi:hypothetical protein
MASDADRDWAAEVNGAEDDDEALRIAIALSLGKDPSEMRGQASRKGAGVIDLTQDDEGNGNGDGERKPRETPAPQQTTASTTSLSSLAALDRKKMEEERLARLGKRKAPQSEDDAPSGGSRPPQRPRIAAESSPSLASASAAPGEEDKSRRLRDAASTPSLATATSRAGRLSFPHGVVKKTWAYGQPRQGDDIRIQDVLQKDQLELAVLSSYQWDEEWMLSRIDLDRTKLILIAFAVSERQVSDLWLPHYCG